MAATVITAATELPETVDKRKQALTSPGRRSATVLRLQRQGMIEKLPKHAGSEEASPTGSARRGYDNGARASRSVECCALVLAMVCLFP